MVKPRYRVGLLVQFVVPRNDTAARPVGPQKHLVLSALRAFEPAAQGLQCCVAKTGQQGCSRQHCVMAAFFAPDP